MKRKNLDSQIKNLEKRMKNKNCGVGVILQADGTWQLFFNGKSADFQDEQTAKAAFYRQAGADTTLIIW